MALTSDQTAVLELLLAGQSYEDLAALLDLGEDEVRARARAALTEVGGADPDRTVGLTDYLLGHADPIGRADAVRHLRQDAADHELAAAISARLAEIAPAAELPKLPPPPGGGRFLSREPSPARDTEPTRRSPLAAIPRERGRLYVGLGAAAVLLVGVVLAVSGVFSGDDESPAADATSEPADGDGGNTIGEVPAGEELLRVPLSSTGGGDAAGAAIIGLTQDDQPYMDLILRNLDPPPNGQQYIVWFMFDKETGYPVPPPIVPDADGSYASRLTIPQAVTSLVFNQRLGADSIEISLSGAADTLRKIEQAAQAGNPLIRRPGQTILSGPIPQGASGQQQGG